MTTSPESNSGHSIASQGLLDTSVFNGQKEQLRGGQGSEIASWYESEWRKEAPKSISKMPTDLPRMSQLKERVQRHLAKSAELEAAEKERRMAEEALLAQPAGELPEEGRADGEAACEEGF